MLTIVCYSDDYNENDWFTTLLDRGSTGSSMGSTSKMLYTVIDNTMDCRKEKLYDYKPTVKEFVEQIHNANDIGTVALHYLDSKTRIKGSTPFKEMKTLFFLYSSLKSKRSHLLVITILSM